MIRCFILILFLATLQDASAQTLDKYVNRLFFGVVSHNPDTTIAEFVRKYVPVIYKEFPGGGKWSAYGTTDEPQYITVTNAYVFKTHPYVHLPFKSGQLAITQRIYDEKKYIDQISDFKLWFEFDKEADAKIFYKKLVDTFSTFNVLKRLTSKDGIDKAELTDKKSNNYYSHIQIILAKDFFETKDYIIPSKDGMQTFSETGYKILLEIGNDLY